MAGLIVHEPATGEVLWRGECGDPHAEAAEARLAQPGWAALPQRTRTELLRRFANVVRAEGTRFADLIARETGTPLWDAAEEVEVVIAAVELAIAAQVERAPARARAGELGVTAALRHRPIGVLALVTPAATPARIAAEHLLPALLAGNAIVLKPSEKAPASAALLIALLHRAGVPEGAARLLIGGPEAGAALAVEADVDGVILIGSVETGRALHRALAGRPDRLLALHLGGNNPLVAWDAPDVQAAARIAVHSAYLGAGRRCTAARRLIVRDGRHGPLLTSIGRLIDRLIVGAPHDRPAPFCGPLIDEAAARAVEDRYAALIDAGAQVLRPLARPIAGRPFLIPALIDVTGIAVADDEVFGPLLQVIRVESADAAIAAANATRHGLAAALIGRDPALFDRFRTEVRAGAIHWNRPTHALAPGAPFAGRGMSGNHRAGGGYAPDLCLAPVSSSEAETPRLDLPRGLRES